MNRTKAKFRLEFCLFSNDDYEYSKNYDIFCLKGDYTERMNLMICDSKYYDIKLSSDFVGRVVQEEQKIYKWEDRDSECKTEILFDNIEKEREKLYNELRKTIKQIFSIMRKAKRMSSSGFGFSFNEIELKVDDLITLYRIAKNEGYEYEFYKEKISVAESKIILKVKAVDKKDADSKILLIAEGNNLVLAKESLYDPTIDKIFEEL
jgi:hypothetical protein